MKNIIVGLKLMLLSVLLFPQDIASVRSQGIGASVTVTGIVTNGDELGVIRYVEDGTAGIAIYDLSTNNYLNGAMRGDSITISGDLVDYNGLLEMNPTSAAIIHSSNHSLTPQIITPVQIEENTESELIHIDAVIFNNGGSTFTGNTTFDFTSNGQTGKIYIKSGHTLVNTLIPMGQVTLIGILSQHTYNFGCTPNGAGHTICPANDGYQILPRDTADIIQSGTIVFTSPVIQSNITDTSFDLTWSVSANSTTNCNYGTTLLLGNVINNGGNTQSHTISLTGLSPATFYYVECYSVDGLDTAFSSIGIYSTASHSSGIIRPYFNHTVDTSFSTGLHAINVGSAFADTIAYYMGLAQNTLDICVYNASDNTIANAINDAYNRGVSVRYIADDDAANIMLSQLDPNIVINYRDPNIASGIMHNKFIIIDANTMDNSWILSGSTNWSNPTNLINDYNNMIFIQDEALAKAYTLEFEEMWGGNFGYNKSDNTPHKFMINGKLVELYFSPSDQTTSQILKTISEVDHTLEFGLLAFTRDDLGQAVIDKDIEFGVGVRGIIETKASTSGGEYDKLVDANVNVRSHEGVQYQFHHKYLIADANSINADPLVLTGSHNWSNNAENNSDENTLIIHDHHTANIYLQEFEKRWGELANTNQINELIDIQMIVFPNPSNSGQVYINSDLKIKQIEVYSIDGRFIQAFFETNIIETKNRGVFLLKIITEKGAVIRKIIIE